MPVIPTESIFKTADNDHGVTLPQSEIFVLNAGITVSAAGAGADGISAQSALIKILSNSHVISALGAGIRVGSQSTARIDAGATVSGKSYGVLLDVGNNTGDFISFQNAGSVSGDIGVAIQRSDYERDLSDVVTNTGLIQGKAGAGIKFGLKSGTIVNSGTITGTEGIQMLQAGGLKTIVNSGTIIGQSGVAINVASGSEYLYTTIINRGSIQGDVKFGRQIATAPFMGDLYDGRGGTITGNVYLDHGHDRAYGGIGTEVFHGGWGDDTLEGGGGNDTAVFSGAFANYTITSTGTRSFTVKDNGLTTEGTDSLKDIRFAKFSDKTEVLYNTAPTGIAFDKTAFAENALVNTPLATLAAQDAEGDALTYTLTDPTGTFRLDGKALVLVKPLDYETKTSYALTLTVKDEFGGTATQTLTVSVTDVADSPGNPGEPGNPGDAPLTLTGKAGADTLAGKGANDTLFGLSGKDRLYGNGGNDKLHGGSGNDVLVGGAGSDIFVFDARLAKTQALNKRQNLDTISDFVAADDTIHLKKSVFSKLSKGVLKKDAFYAGTKAHDGSDRIVVNKKTGAVFYDKDGSGAAEAIQIASLTKNLKGMSHLDFFVV